MSRGLCVEGDLYILHLLKNCVWEILFGDYIWGNFVKCNLA